MQHPPSRSSSGSAESYHTSFQYPDRRSLHSYVSSDDGTLHSDYHGGSGPILKLGADHSPPKFLGDAAYKSSHKSLPLLPKGMFFEKDRQREYDPYAVEQRENPVPLQHPTDDFESLGSHEPPLTTTTQLAGALGPDNAPHAVEIDSIPCSGVRIPHGSLFGLLAWRLVVRVPSAPKGQKGEWWDDANEVKAAIAAVKRGRRSSSANALSVLLPPTLTLHRPKPTHSHSFSETPVGLNLTNPGASHSAVSLPLPIYKRNKGTKRPSPLAQGQKPPTSCVTNFILDTSLPYSIISRETLLFLGYPAHLLPPTHTFVDSNAFYGRNADPPTVTLSIQGISTILRIARPGEASRLGVQFLHDAGVSVFFPRDGEGVGPVLYVENARLLKDVPITVHHLPGGAKGLGSKQSLQQRVRALFGLVAS